MKKAIFTVVLFLSMVMIFGSALTTFAGRTAGVAIDDATITTKVKYELATDVKFSTLKTVQVDTHRSEVTLTGRVHTREEKEHAGFVTDQVNGVAKVHNMLSIVPEKKSPRRFYHHWICPASTMEISPLAPFRKRRGGGGDQQIAFKEAPSAASARHFIRQRMLFPVCDFND